MQSKHPQKRTVSLLLAICLLCGLRTSAAAVGAAAGGYAETYGINVPFTPSARTSRYTFAVYEGNTAAPARLLIQKELTISTAQTVFLPIPSLLSGPGSYTLAVTAHPMPEREGLDTAATKTVPFRLEPTCGHPGASGAFLIGDGSAQSPYLITSAAQLDHLRQHTGAYARQGCDLDMAGIAWQNFNFSGTYDGNGYVVRNLSNNSSGFGGLFAEVTGTVMNLGVENATVRGTYAAAICGNLRGKIYCCYVKDCIITATTSVAGGITGNDGANYQSIIQDCYEMGGTYQTSVASGGIAGDFSGDVSGNALIRCYSIPAKVTGGKKGILVGNWRSAKMQDCYFPSDTSCGSTTATASGNVSGAVGMPFASFPNAANFSGWNIGADSSAWVMGESAPELKIFAQRRARDYALPQGAASWRKGTIGLSD
ncbi:hypothetical protein [Harryflintia acetispora]|uniref:GLUG domain-containing protein n=1 Tax=Harryflintia acetispora TaxID=1849041 RepID=A0A9X8Y893_9FIRM|nr:hypothetical protein [Harryflintia acetispora]TCL43502.1 hypothetical protein EDD78_105134 [Harryflintia acetispora]